ncbi:MAG: 4Fe-4S binding protein, partial [Gammaproteobacteria bacterium]|nr:4Fe-4S binding protein [Gammaproteobacteria bacterium]
INTKKAEKSLALPDRDFIFLSALLIVAIVLRFNPKRNLRRAFLIIILVAAGFALNFQYSSDHVMALLSMQLPPVALSAAFFMVVFIPLSLIFFGNIYCGWLCPFGAMQELIGELRPNAFASDPEKETWRYGRFVKYALLLLLIILFCVSGDRSVLGADPLITLFGKARENWIIIFASAIIAASFFYCRFWCRNLCPVGAFCSLLGSVNLLRRFMPACKPAACDLGVRSVKDLDCIQCDRCRHE